MKVQGQEVVERGMLCGTRLAVKLADQSWRVVCATCDAGGTVKYATKQQAGSRAIALSTRACLACGAN